MAPQSSLNTSCSKGQVKDFQGISETLGKNPCGSDKKKKKKKSISVITIAQFMACFHEVNFGIGML